MKKILLAVLILMLQVHSPGCAQTTSTGSQGADESAIALEAKGGYYAEKEIAFADSTIELTMLSTKKDPKWGPLQSLCVRASSTNERVCLEFFVLPDSGNEMFVQKRVLSADSQSVIWVEDLDGSYQVGEPIQVHVGADDNVLKFAVNGAKPITHKLGGAPAHVRMLCSTASCNFHVL